MGVKVKSVEEILASPYIRQKDIERALEVSGRQAATIFVAAKKYEREQGILEVAARKVRRESVEKVTGIRFSRMAKEKAAAGGAASGVGTPGK